RDGDAARLAPLLRTPPPRARRRPALDPGAPRPCLAGDDTDLRRSRRRAAERRLPRRASARLRLICVIRHAGALRSGGPGMTSEGTTNAGSTRAAGTSRAWRRGGGLEREDRRP